MLHMRIRKWQKICMPEALIEHIAKPEWLNVQPQNSLTHV